MEKSCHSSGGGDSTAAPGSTNTRNSSTTDMYLKHLNKLSHKVSKPNRRQSSPTVDPETRFSQPATAQSQPLNTLNNNQQQQQQQLQQQPPVYTINKSDFRDVVQRLTGSPASSPAREAFSSPPPVFPQPKTKPSSSRLQKIRPPPLAQISNRPPNLLNYAALPNRPQFPQPSFSNSFGSSAPPSSVFPGGQLCGQRQPLSPLPPFPTVHVAAESPVSAYMRFLQNSFGLSPNPEAESKKFPLLSPRWNTVNQMLPPPPPPQFPSHQQQNIPPPPPPPPPPQQNARPPLAGAPAFPAFPSSPLAFGCLNSPGMFSQSLMFSPTGQLGFPQLPLSPTVPVPSPRWRGH